MKQEEINKAAEEARRASAETLTTFGTQHYIDDVVAITAMKLSYDEVAESAFVKGAEWVLSQPLCNRLSDTEKKEIREIYRVGVESMEYYAKQLRVAASKGSEKLLECLFYEHNSRLNLLISIFDKDLFTDKTEL